MRHSPTPPLQHLAIIMDGNGRWAQLRNKPRTYGHIRGAKVAKQIIIQASDIGIKHLTLYAFSAENWLRPAFEVSFLLNLLRRYLVRETDNLVKKNIRFTAIGDRERLPKDLQTMILESEKATCQCTGLNVHFAISYGARQEIARAVKNILLNHSDQIQSASEEDIEDLLEASLYTNGVPDPDLIIRTSGEERLSNFLLWQAAYSEFYFTNVLWPDMKSEDLVMALREFHLRTRRFGTVGLDEVAFN